MGFFSSPDMRTQSTTGTAANTKADMRATNSSYDAACTNTTNKKETRDAAASDLNKAKQNTAVKEQAVTDAQNKQKVADAKIDTANANYKAAETAKSTATDKKSDLQEERAKLDGDTSPEAAAERDRLDTAIATEDAKIVAANKDMETAQTDKGIAEKELADAEVEETKAKTELDTAEKEEDAANDKFKDADSEYEKAVENEEDVRKEQAEKYPETFGKKSEEFDGNLDKDEAKAESDADMAEQKKREEEASKAKAELDAKRKAAQAEVDAAEALLAKATTPAEAARLQAELDAKKAALAGVDTKGDPFVNSLLGIGLDALMGNKNGRSGYLYWDAMRGGFGETGRMEDLIAQHIEPKQKHAFVAEFPANHELGSLVWLVKTMDRPKIDIEYVEQIRNNVKRQYPVKYNFGDLSLTLWDDIYHTSITAINSYFVNKVWQHPVHKGPGAMYLRNTTIIPELIIYDLVTDASSSQVLKYTFFNAQLSSFDFDAHDTDDEGTHVIQVVFKIEGYNVQVGGNPRYINLQNNPLWPGGSSIGTSSSPFQNALLSTLNNR